MSMVEGKPLGGLLMLNKKMKNILVENQKGIGFRLKLEFPRILIYFKFHQNYLNPTTLFDFNTKLYLLTLEIQESKFLRL
eukprot:snap_masked-scaffold_1-processed-gene-12.18-mRNA-1 protein AED:1.00 eAED:1.00 QI:0/0/0/0/1/1/2/0/79